MPALKWTVDALQSEASKFETRGDFQNYSPSAYSSAAKRRLLDVVCAHMAPANTQWTLELLMKEAAKYETRQAFVKGSKKAYAAAHDRGLLDRVCGHMRRQLRQWTTDELKTAAAPYKIRNDFRFGNPAAYSIAKYRGLLDLVCAHMDGRKMKWSNKEIVEEANKYTRRADFKANSGAYHAAVKRGMLDTVCKHMTANESAYRRDSKACLYYIRVERVWSGPLYKIGVSNKSVRERYISEQASIDIIKIWWFDKGSDAAREELKILKNNSAYLYKGDPVLTRGGNSELFTKDVLNLDKKAA